MQYLTLFMLREDAAAAALALADLGVFAPQDPGTAGLPEAPAADYRPLYAGAARRLGKILAYTKLAPRLAGLDATAPVTREALRRCAADLGRVWAVFARCEERERVLIDEQRQVDQLTRALREYEALDVDLGMLQGRLRFLDIHLGTLAARDLARLRQALGLLGYTVTPFKQTGDTAHVVIAGLRGDAGALERVLRAASFRPLAPPPEFHARPNRLRTELEERRRRLARHWEGHRRAVEQETRRHAAAVQDAARILARAAPYAELAAVLHGNGRLVCCAGWVPADRVALVRERLDRRIGPHALVARAPAPEERTRVPSAFRYPRWLLPYAVMVRSYGVPRYGEMDPTWLFAITFVAMFGMMFGDVGDGAVIALGGLLLPRHWRMYRPFAVGAGLSSICFGVLYGSLFGRAVFAPLWLAPLSAPLYALDLALYWGIGFILVASLITVRNHVAEGRYVQAVLDVDGLAGVLFYAGLLYAVSALFTGRLNWLAGLGVIGPLAVILGRIWRRNPAGAGERLLIVAVEAFETTMRYISNTLSFLRVAAFSLNHAALAVAVYMIAHMLGTAGYWATVILGNVFILVLEGGIVAIQVLRLEYYEGFSRFFSGDGRPFQPLTLCSDARAAPGLGVP